MSSRTAQKVAARRAREDAERAAAKAGARRRRMTMLAAVIAAAVLVVLAAVLLSRSGTGSEASSMERAALFAGIPQDGEWLGRPGSPVVVEEYADLQCPFCAAFATRELPAIVRRYVRPGRVRLRLRLLAFIGPDSVDAARVAAATALQDRMWDFTEGFYARQGAENSGYVTGGFLRAAAEGIADLDIERALAERDDPRAAAQRRDAREAARRACVQSTPVFRVGRRGGGMRLAAASWQPRSTPRSPHEPARRHARLAGRRRPARRPPHEPARGLARPVGSRGGGRRLSHLRPLRRGAGRVRRRRGRLRARPGLRPVAPASGSRSLCSDCWPTSSWRAPTRRAATWPAWRPLSRRSPASASART
jgi:protein-disulfide isomerase